MIKIIGLVAAILTTSSLLPQMVQVYKTKKTRDVSLSWTGLLTFGIIFWLIYGIGIKDVPIILANFFGLIFSSAVLIGKLVYKKYE